MLAIKPLHPLVVGAERVLAQHGALGLVVELQVHPVDGEVAALLLGVPDELAAQPGPGGLRRGLLGLEDLQVGGDPVDRAAPLQQRVQAPAAAQVVVGQVHLRDPRVRQRQVVACAGSARSGAACVTQSISRSTPARSPVSTAASTRPHRSRTRLAVASPPRRSTNSLALARYSCWISSALHSLPLASRTLRRPVMSWRDLADRPDRVLQRQVAHRHAGLDHAQHDVGAADLEQRGDLVHVRVADDDVQPAVALGVGVRLVAGVDDRPDRVVAEETPSQMCSARWDRQ